MLTRYQARLDTWLDELNEHVESAEFLAQSTAAQQQTLREIVRKTAYTPDNMEALERLQDFFLPRRVAALYDTPSAQAAAFTEAITFLHAHPKERQWESAWKFLLKEAKEAYLFDRAH